MRHCFSTSLVPRQSRSGQLVEQERDAVAVPPDRLQTHLCRALRRGLPMRGVVFVEPDDSCDVAARQVTLLKPHHGRERCVVHRNHVGAQIVAIGRANQVRGRVVLVHTGQGQQAVAFGRIDPGVSAGVFQVGRLDLLVRHERRLILGRLKPDPALIDPLDRTGNRIAVRR